MPVHTFSEDLSWNHGAHDVRFGVVARLISNSSLSYAHSFSSASSNPSWLKGSGNDLAPASLGLSKGDTQSFQYGMGALLGLEVQGNANYNYLVDGTLVTPGLPVARDFVNHEGEFYVQDTWKVTRNFTVTGGIRLSLAPPVYEANGQQASTNIPLGRLAVQARHPGGPGTFADRARGWSPSSRWARAGPCIRTTRTGLRVSGSPIRPTPIAGFPSSSSADRARLPSAPAPACTTT